MPIYLAIPLNEQGTALDTAVQQHIPETDRYKLQAGSGWLISFSGTAIELTNKLGITGQGPGESPVIRSALITAISASYYGRGPTDMWEWLKTRFEQ